MITEVMIFGAILMTGVFGLTLMVAARYAPNRLPNAASELSNSEISSQYAFWIFLILFSVAVAIGLSRLATRLIKETSSHELRNVLASRGRQAAKNLTSSSKSAVEKDLPVEEGLPTVPDGGGAMTDSPGERLSYRLAHTGTNSTVLGFAFLTVLWCVVWFVLLGISVSGFWYGPSRPVLTLLLIPLAWVGYRAIRTTIQRLREMIGVGPTILEISDHPLYPGQEYEIFVAQFGRMNLRQLTVQLICEESTFFRQGTDLRMDQHEALTEELYLGARVEVDRGRSWEQQLRFTLPPGVMHSMATGNNAIRWKIVVRGESSPWPSFCRSFPVIVHPPLRPPNRSPR